MGAAERSKPAPQPVSTRTRCSSHGSHGGLHDKAVVTG